jgi:transposase
MALEEWLRERLRRHRGNADVIRQELAVEKGIIVSLRTVERAVKPYRQELVAEARATVRFETPPGRQMQIDFGERLVEIGGNRLRVYSFVATLGFSRRLQSRPRSSWLFTGHLTDRFPLKKCRVPLAFARHTAKSGLFSRPTEMSRDLTLFTARA